MCHVTPPAKAEIGGADGAAKSRPASAAHSRPEACRPPTAFIRAGRKVYRYRALGALLRPHPASRADRGAPLGSPSVASTVRHSAKLFGAERREQIARHPVRDSAAAASATTGGSGSQCSVMLVTIKSRSSWPPGAAASITSKETFACVSSKLLRQARIMAGAASVSTQLALGVTRRPDGG